jgi:hypothetical protein
MVFPGGAREATKRKSERYQLIWTFTLTNAHFRRSVCALSAEVGPAHTRSFAESQATHKVWGPLARWASAGPRPRWPVGSWTAHTGSISARRGPP